MAVSDFYTPEFAGCEKTSPEHWQVSMRSRWMSDDHLNAISLWCVIVGAASVALGVTIAYKLHEFKLASTLTGCGCAFLRLAIELQKAVSIRREFMAADAIEAARILFDMEQKYLEAHK